ncbi:MAG: amino acid decarboxylase [Segetibacter sp.]|nr:amino acid decarboxylase [Segetibacter sp.]
MKLSTSTEETLDPENWESFRKTAHTMMDDMINYLRDVRQRPVWQPTSASSKQFLSEPLSNEPESFDAIYEQFKENILPYTLGNIHPAFWGWVCGNGSATGMLADMLSSAMNPSPSFGDHADIYVEQQVINWVKQVFGLSPGSSGLLTTGASVANLIALATARNHHEKKIRVKGLKYPGKQLTLYASAETHSCIQKAVELLGIGSEHLRKIEVDDNYKIRIDLLVKAIEKDKTGGYEPFCIIGNAGTVNTGAIDDLNQLAIIAKKENLWFHVDGAFGIVPKILPEFDEILKGCEAADSLAFDFHKWFYVNYDVGCVMIRDQSIHEAAFEVKANYLLKHERGIIAGPGNFHHLGVELTRGFRSLKVWMMLKENGLAKYQRLIRQNLNQAQYLCSLINESEDLELLAPVHLNIVCFRFNPRNTEQQQLNLLNKEILMQLHEQGIAAPSYTLLNGKYAIRVAITNHRSVSEDFKNLTEEVVRIGEQVKFSK